MLSTFKVTVISLLRNKAVIVWALIFPIILSTLFMMMFSELDKRSSYDPVACAVVNDDAFQESEQFRSFVASLSEGNDPLLRVTEVASAQEAEELLVKGEVKGIISMDPSLSDGAYGKPQLTIGASSTSTVDTVDQSILKLVCDGYNRNMYLVQTIAQENPQAFMQAESLESAFAASDAAEITQITFAPPHVSAQFYYALLGMAALFAANVACIAICAAQPNMTALGARRTVGALSRSKMLAATLAASWMLSFAFLGAAFLYIRYVIGIDFYGREWACAVGLAAASLMTTCLGLLIGAIPKISASSKGGIITGITCFASLFAGLYGDPCMQLAETVARNWPVLANINPAKVITDAFYALYYYDSLAPFVLKVSILLGMAVVFFGLSLIFVRRQRYASL